MASLAERIAEAKASAEAAEARVSGEAFLREEEQRKELAELDARRREAEKRELDMLVARILDDAPEGAEAVVIETPIAIPLPEAKPEGDMPGHRLQTIVDDLPKGPVMHVFTVQAAGAASYRRMQQGLRDAAVEKIAKGTREKVTTDAVHHAYAVDGIIGWNAGGASIDVEETDGGALLHKFMRANPAVVSQISDRVARLDGAASEARKR